MSQRLYGHVVGAVIGVVFAIGALSELIGIVAAIVAVVALLAIGTLVTIFGGQYRNQRSAQVPGSHLTALTILGGAAIAAAWAPEPWPWVAAPVIGVVAYAVTRHAWDTAVRSSATAD